MTASFHELEHRHLVLSDKYLKNTFSDISQRAEIERLLIDIRLASQQIAEPSQRKSLKEILEQWSIRLLRHDGLIFSPVDLLPLKTISRPSGDPPVKPEPETSENQEFGYKLVATKWLEKTELYLSLHQELEKLTQEPRYPQKLLEHLFSFSQTVKTEPIAFHTGLIGLKCKPDDIYAVRQAILVICHQHWDKDQKIGIAYKRKLRDTMRLSFRMHEIESLCFELDIQVDQITGSSLQQRIENLIHYVLDRSNNDFFRLVTCCYLSRIERNWDYGP